jgi:hypothetical protein
MQFVIALALYTAAIAVASMIASAATLGTPFPGNWLPRGDGSDRDEEREPAPRKAAAR